MLSSQKCLLVLYTNLLICSSRLNDWLTDYSRIPSQNARVKGKHGTGRCGSNKKKITHVRPSLTEWINKRILNINKTLRIIKLAANIDAQAHYKPNGDSIHEIQTNKIDRLKIIKIICVYHVEMEHKSIWIRHQIMDMNTIKCETTINA